MQACAEANNNILIESGGGGWGVNNLCDSFRMKGETNKNW